MKTGTTFAGYRVEATIGRGGTGVVYRTTDLSQATSKERCSTAS